MQTDVRVVMRDNHRAEILNGFYVKRVAISSKGATFS